MVKCLPRNFCSCSVEWWARTIPYITIGLSIAFLTDGIPNIINGEIKGLEKLHLLVLECVRLLTLLLMLIAAVFLWRAVEVKRRTLLLVWLTVCAVTIVVHIVFVVMASIHRFRWLLVRVPVLLSGLYMMFWIVVLSYYVHFNAINNEDTGQNGENADQRGSRHEAP